MKRITSTIASVTTVAGLAIAPLALSAPASADTPTCVTKAEFSKVKKGWSIGRVRNLFDVPGKQSYFISGSAYSNPSQSRDYKPCTKYSTVSVDYERKAGVWRVTSKFGYWA